MGLAAFTHGLPVIVFPFGLNSMSEFGIKLKNLNV